MLYIIEWDDTVAHFWSSLRHFIDIAGTADAKVVYSLLFQ